MPLNLPAELQDATRLVAVCILRYIYEISSALLSALKNFIMMLLGYMDALLLQLKALVATYDILVLLEQATWNIVEAVINKMRDALLSIVEGPGTTCPEFYTEILGPAQDIFEGMVAGLGGFRTRYLNVVSSKDAVELLIVYWEAKKTTLLLIIDVIDDALYQAAQREAQAILEG